MKLSTRYTVKGVGIKQTIDSVVNIYTNEQGNKIVKVEDKWSGKLPDSSFIDVSLIQIFSPGWWLYYAYSWQFWTWSLVWYTRPWMVRVCGIVILRWLVLCMLVNGRFANSMFVSRFSAT